MNIDKKAAVQALLFLALFSIVFIAKGPVESDVYRYGLLLLLAVSAATSSVSPFVEGRLESVTRNLPFTLWLMGPFAYASMLTDFGYLALIVILLILFKGQSLLGRFYEPIDEEEIWLTGVAALGFWVMLLRFHEQGLLALVIAVNTAVLIGVLGFILPEEEGLPAT